MKTLPAEGPLSGVRILDLSRILAGPSCTQLLGDLGADVIKIERPGTGDDTRNWGPPFLSNEAGEDTSESAYFLSANRNKRSLTINISDKNGQQLLQQLAAKADVLIENFKVGGLKKYRLDYEALHELYPKLIYCSISGFGQTGPYANYPGYDFMIQGMGGVMSITGETDGEPMKVGIAIVDLMCGMYASVAILGALRHREHGGGGQHIDLALLDTHAAWLINVGMNYLISDQSPKRYGNGHANIVPYQPFPASDGHFILTVGNDVQFRKFCDFAEIGELANDQRFASNPGRVKNRELLVNLISKSTVRHHRNHWLSGLKQRGVPCGPVNTVPEVFADPQIQHREMLLGMSHPLVGKDGLKMIGNPIKYSKTPVSYRRPPPMLGEHSHEILQDWLGLDESELIRLEEMKVFGAPQDKS